MATERPPFIALALSGGGARAIAFHLGCMRALHDRGVLDRVNVISTVSGGSVVGAVWAYTNAPFEEFDTRIVSLLRSGLQREIAREAFLTRRLVGICATLLVNGGATLILRTVMLLLGQCRRWLGMPTARLERSLATLLQRLPVWDSLTTALEAALARTLFSQRRVDDVARPNLRTVINACDLRTGTAFRFGSDRSGGWRYGDITSNVPTVAKAVSASAAFPILLPPLIETFAFVKNGVHHTDTVSLTDGGVYDNLGVAVVEPGRTHEGSIKYPVTHLICLNAGGGQFDGDKAHFWWPGRVERSFVSVHRKVQDAVYRRLHGYVEEGALKAFGMVYLGQQDDRLPWAPPDLVRREQVKDYPTDFAPMSDKDLDLLAGRGEQLTHIIVDRYLADIAA